MGRTNKCELSIAAILLILASFSRGGCKSWTYARSEVQKEADRPYVRVSGAFKKAYLIVKFDGVPEFEGYVSSDRQYGVVGFLFPEWEAPVLHVSMSLEDIEGHEGYFFKGPVFGERTFFLEQGSFIEGGLYSDSNGKEAILFSQQKDPFRSA